MSLPVSHEMAGLSLGLAWVLPRGRVADWTRAIKARFGFLLMTLFLAMAPDLDIFPGLLSGHLNAFHQGLTHTAGWCLLFAFGMYACWHAFHPEDGWRCWLFFSAVALSHLLVDFMTEDGRLPYGIMAFWPLSNQYFISGLSMFLGPEKATFRALFQWHNAKVMLVDALWCLPLLLAVLAWKWTGWNSWRRPK